MTTTSCRPRIALTVVAVGLAACSSDPPKRCDPLAAAEQPIALATLIGAGRHPDNTIYLLDRSGSAYRVFVGTGLEVRRRRVAGGGEFPTPEGGMAVTVSVTEPDPFRLKVETTGGMTRMGVLRGMTDARDFVIGQQGDVLVALTVTDVQALSLRNLSGGVFVEYVAALPDGRQLVVIRPEDDWGYEDFRLFLGPTERLEERKVHSVTRQRDGGTTHIRFDLEGGAAEAFFPAAQNTLEPATLTIGGETLPLVVTRGMAPSGMYFCRS